MKHPWKRNFRKMPTRIRAKLAKMSGDVRVGCAKKITEAHLTSGRYAHLGITLADGQLNCQSEVVPPARNGRYSERNVHGHTVKHKDRPMTSKEFSVEAPNFGDWSRGSHTMSWDRDVYQTTFYPPRELGILIGQVSETHVDGERTWVLSFMLDQVIGLTDDSAEDDLFFSLNLLQENVGAVDILPANTKNEDFLRTVHVDWEILPPGEKDDVIQKVLRKYGTQTEELREKVEARYRLLMILRPKAFINGVSGFRRYFGAVLADDLVVFENLEYGNAIYVMYDDWEELSKLSRLELLKMQDRNFERIVHGKGWEDKLIGFATEAEELRKARARRTKEEISKRLAEKEIKSGGGSQADQSQPAAPGKEAGTNAS